MLPNDMDARVNFQKKDQNGDVCAIIKVVTTETGFSWDGDQLGITKVEKKVGEYWLYVPFGAKRLTIKHSQLGILRDYRYEEAIQKATVYELVLVSGKVATTVIPVEPVWLTIRSTPDGADVYVDEVLKGTTPYALKLLPGKHSYRVEKVLYHATAGNVEINGQEKDGKKDLPVVLKPAFGTININTLPEQGAKVLLDDTETGETTPFSMSKVNSGTHKVTVKKDFFQPKSIELIVKDGEITEQTIMLSFNAAKVNVNAQNDADIYIDGKYVAKGSFQGRIPAGVVTFEAKKEGYYSDKKDKDIAVGETVTINLTPQPQVGSVDIVSNPIDAMVFLNGEQKGITPITLKNLLVGKYNLKLEKEGYLVSLNEISITENKTTYVNEKLLSSQEKTIQSVKVVPKKEIAKQGPINISDKPIYNTDYYKYKKSKNVWLVSALVSGGAGAFSYLQAKNYYNQYQTATTDAESLYSKAQLYNTISSVALGIAGFCAIEFVLKSTKQGKAKKQSLGLYPQPFNQGAGLNLVYKF
jgi:hypothetical protein